MNMFLRRFATVAAAVLTACASFAAPTWETGKYTLGDWTPSAHNLLSGLSGTYSGAWYTGNDNPGNNVSLLTDGTIPGSKGTVAAIATENSTITYTLAAASNIEALKIFSWWTDGGRDGIAINKVEVKYDGDASFTDLGASAIAYGCSYDGNDNKSGSTLYAILTDANGDLATNVVELRITFGKPDNSGAGFAEIEATGRVYSGFEIESGLSFDTSAKKYTFGADIITPGIALAVKLVDENSNETTIPLANNLAVGSRTFNFDVPDTTKTYTVQVTTVGLAEELSSSLGTISPRVNDVCYGKYIDFTVGNGYAGASTLNDFPVLVRLSETAISNLDWNDFAANGADIRFIDATGVLIPHEIDTWDTSAGGESLVWVKLPAMALGTTFRMYYNERASGPTALPTTDVWSAFAGV